MSARRGLGLLLAAVAFAAVLQAAGPALPAPPFTDPDRLGAWWSRQGTAVAALSLVRIGGLAFCCYLGVISALGVVAALTRWHWTERLAGWAATPALRRVIAGGSLAAAVTSSYAATATTPTAYSVTDLGTVEAVAAGAMPTIGTPGANTDRAQPGTATEPMIGAPGAKPAATVHLALPARSGPHTVTDIGMATAERSTTGAPVAAIANAATRNARPPGSDPLIARPGTARQLTLFHAVADLGPIRHATSDPSITRSHAAHPPADQHAVAALGPATELGASDPSITRSHAAHPPADQHAVADLGPATELGAMATTLRVPQADAVDDPETWYGPQRSSTERVSDEPAQRGEAAADRDSGAETARPRHAQGGDRGGADTWVVEDGDHLWGIAAATVFQRGGGDDHLTIARYWIRLIDANTDVVGADPDLIHPGQIIRLPA